MDGFLQSQIVKTHPGDFRFMCYLLTGFQASFSDDKARNFHLSKFVQGVRLLDQGNTHPISGANVREDDL